MKIPIDRKLKIQLLKAIQTGVIDLNEIRELNPAANLRLSMHGIYMEYMLNAEKTMCEKSPEMMQYKVDSLQRWIDQFKSGKFYETDDSDIIEAVQRMYELDSQILPNEEEGFTEWQQFNTIWDEKGKPDRVWFLSTELDNSISI